MNAIVELDHATRNIRSLLGPPSRPSCARAMEASVADTHRAAAGSGDHRALQKNAAIPCPHGRKRARPVSRVYW